MVQILNVFERTIALLACQFRDKNPDGSFTNFQKLINILCKPAQELQYVLWELKTQRWLSTAIGVQLDEIGIILGLARNFGESDEDYRERLQFQIFINVSSGTPEDIIRALKFLTQANKIVFFDVFPAFFQLETDGLKFPIPPNDLNDAIFRMSPAGVNYAPITATYNVPISFQTFADISLSPLYVVPDENNPQDEFQLLMQPYNEILYVNNLSEDSAGLEGGLDELDFPSPIAGQLSELIQKNGNFPPRR